jgi:hypothetical protein
MGLRLLAAFLVTVLGGCGGSQVTAEPDPRPSLAAAFEAHLGEYLDPAWTSQPGEGGSACIPYDFDPQACGLESAVVGDVVIVDASAREISGPFLDALAWPDRAYVLGNIRENKVTPISLAATPAEVDTVVLVWSVQVETRTSYSDGTKAYRTDYRVKVVDFEKQAVVGEATIMSSDFAPFVKSVPGDWIGSPPWEELLIALSCAADRSCSPAPTPTAEPTPTREEELEAACGGTPVPWAARYAGKVHPLVVVDEGTGGIDASYVINRKWRSDTWTSPIQLVVCAPFEPDTSVKAGSCGRWKRQSDGVVGELIKTRHTSTIRVVVARTGKTLQSQILYGSVAPCGDAPEDQWSIPDMNDDPPWHLFGIRVTNAQVNTYATAVSKQAVK